MAFYYTARDLQHDMMADLDKVIFDVAILAKDIVTENVANIVYNPYSPIMYERKGWDRGFIGSWDVSDENRKISKANLITYKIFSNPTLMDYIPKKSQHGSPDGITNRTSIMAAIIAEGTDYDYNSYLAESYRESAGIEIDWWTEPRDYFTPSLEKISEEMDFMVQDAYKSLNVDALPSALFNN